MAKHKVVDVLVPLHVLLGKANQELFLFAHVRLLLAIGPLQAAILRPVQSQSHAPTWVKSIEQSLASTVVEHRLQELKLLVRVTKSITVCQEEYLVVYLHGLRLVVNDDSTLFL